MKSFASLEIIQKQLYNSELTLTDLVTSYLDKIAELKGLNAYVDIFEEEALIRASELDKKRKTNPDSCGSLHGAVISIKDVLNYRGHSVGAASRILQGYEATYNATAVERLLEADAIIIGRTNCDEFAMGSTNEYSAYGPALNGSDPRRVPGGSSGGAAVSVQTNTCLAALGSDTGGSVRQPAAYCGVTGFKPSYGKISRHGLIAYASSFDQIGLITKNVKDAALILRVIEGSDAYDSTCSSPSPTNTLFTGHSSPYKIATFDEVMRHPKLAPQIRETCLELLSRLSKQGHDIVETSFSLLDYAVPAYYVLTTAEASSNLSRYDGIRYGYRNSEAGDLDELILLTRSSGFGLEVKRRIMMGTFVLSVGYYEAYFEKAQKVRRLIRDQIRQVFEHNDFIILPATTDRAPLIGDSTSDPVKMYLSDVFTVIANICGLPAISIPFKSKDGSFDIGIQIMANQFEESKLLNFAHHIQFMA